MPDPAVTRLRDRALAASPSASAAPEPHVRQFLFFLQGQHESVDFRGLRPARRLRPRDPLRPGTPGPLRRRWGSWAHARAYTADRASSRVPPDPVPLPDPLGDRRLPSEAGLSVSVTSPVHIDGPISNVPHATTSAVANATANLSGLMHGINSSEFQGPEAPQRGGPAPLDSSRGRRGCSGGTTSPK